MDGAGLVVHPGDDVNARHSTMGARDGCTDAGAVSAARRGSTWGAKQPAQAFAQVAIAMSWVLDGCAFPASDALRMADRRATEEAISQTRAAVSVRIPARLFPTAQSNGWIVRHGGQRSTRTRRRHRRNLRLSASNKSAPCDATAIRSMLLTTPTGSVDGPQVPGATNVAVSSEHISASSKLM